jgi:hypothetical protein
MKTVFWFRSRGSEIKLPATAGAEITNCGSGPGSDSFLFTTILIRLKKFYKKPRVLKKFLLILTF